MDSVPLIPFAGLMVLVHLLASGVLLRTACFLFNSAAGAPTSPPEDHSTAAEYWGNGVPMPSYLWGSWTIWATGALSGALIALAGVLVHLLLQHQAGLLASAAPLLLIPLCFWLHLSLFAWMLRATWMQAFVVSILHTAVTAMAAPIFLAVIGMVWTLSLHPSLS